MSEDGHLGDREFAELVRNAPLVSMDLVIRDSHRRVLLCLRQHEPAKNCFFVPGGRIRKNETLAQAFERILEAEAESRSHRHVISGRQQDGARSDDRGALERGKNDQPFVALHRGRMRHFEDLRR